jgi:hypothetical protein
VWLARRNGGVARGAAQWQLPAICRRYHTLGEYDVSEANEPFHAFVENAPQKARGYPEMLMVAALATQL